MIASLYRTQSTPPLLRSSSAPGFRDRRSARRSFPVSTQVSSVKQTQHPPPPFRGSKQRSQDEPSSRSRGVSVTALYRQIPCCLRITFSIVERGASMFSSFAAQYLGQRVLQRPWIRHSLMGTFEGARNFQGIEFCSKRSSAAQSIEQHLY